MLKKWKLQQVLVYSLAIIVWVNNFQTPEIQAVLSGFFRDGNDIEDNRHWPALRGLSSPPSTNTREPWPSNDAKVPLEAYTGSKKAATETRLVILEQSM